MKLDREKLHILKRHLMQVKNDVIRKVVDFISSSKNIVPISYGVKKIKLSPEESMTLPRLQRKSSLKNI